MLTAKELRAQAEAAIQAAEEAQNRADALADQAAAAEAAEAAQKRTNEYAAHSNQMFEKHGYELTAKQHEIIYAKAYEGRWGDDDEAGIENQYADLAELARMILGSASYL